MPPDGLRSGALRIAAITRSRLKNRSTITLKLYIQATWLSDWRFDFHSTRVSGDETAWVQIVTSAPKTERASRRSTPMLLANTRPRGEVARFTMIQWTTQEISLLIGLWSNASAAQISQRLNRSRASVCGKAMRLRRDDLLSAGVKSARI